jgi:hypothetical protein
LFEVKLAMMRETGQLIEVHAYSTDIKLGGENESAVGVDESRDSRRRGPIRAMAELCGGVKSSSSNELGRTETGGVGGVKHANAIGGGEPDVHAAQASGVLPRRRSIGH